MYSNTDLPAYIITNEKNPGYYQGFDGNKEADT